MNLDTTALEEEKVNFKVMVNNMKTNARVIATIQLMENNKVVHSIKIDNLCNYEFTFDSEKLSTLRLKSPNLNMDDLNMLVTKPYEAYVLMGVKKVVINNKESLYEIPPRVFKHVFVKENGEEVEIFFREGGDNL